MADGSDAIADWPLLNALINTASGASWVSIHHGGGVGIGRSIHAGQVSVADGTELAAQKLARVLTNDPGMGVIRHVDAGYDRAAEVAAERGRPGADARGRVTWWLATRPTARRAQRADVIETRTDRRHPRQRAARHARSTSSPCGSGRTCRSPRSSTARWPWSSAPTPIWAIIGLTLGNILGGTVMALHSAQGPRLGLPQMISSRAQFGVFGAGDPAGAGDRHVPRFRRHRHRAVRPGDQQDHRRRRAVGRAS